MSFLSFSLSLSLSSAPKTRRVSWPCPENSEPAVALLLVLESEKNLSALPVPCEQGSNRCIGGQPGLVFATVTSIL